MPPKFYFPFPSPSDADKQPNQPPEEPSTPDDTDTYHREPSAETPPQPEVSHSGQGTGEWSLSAPKFAKPESVNIARKREGYAKKMFDKMLRDRILLATTHGRKVFYRENPHLRPPGEPVDDLPEGEADIPWTPSTAWNPMTDMASLLRSTSHPAPNYSTRNTQASQSPSTSRQIAGPSAAAKPASGSAPQSPPPGSKQ